MQKLVIKGGSKLSGTIEISGSKNATLPILTSTILTNKKIILKNVPVVKDVETMVNLLKTIGSSVKFDKKNKKIEILNNKKLKTFAPYYLLKTMRAGVLVLGSLLAKYKNAKVSLPGGCAIGSRPIDLHLNALKKMGANINIKNKRIISGEVVADIDAHSSTLSGCELDAEMAKLMIDEYPILSVAAANANSPSIFRGLGELKVKESDRLELIRLNLNKCGCDCKVVNEDLYINPSPKYNIFDNVIKTDFDHRIAMSFAVMGSKIGNLKINQSDSIKTSFPNFLDLFNKAGGNLEWKK